MNTLKLLAQKAKKRLSTAGQTIGCTPEKNTTYLSQTNYTQIATTQDLESDPLYEKVQRLLTKDDIINPIAELTDKNIFNKLSNLEKEKYVINLSKRYNEIKNHLIRNV